MGRPKKQALKLSKPRKKSAESKLSAKTRVILERTKLARAASDAALVGYVDDDPSTPFMVITGPPRRRGSEQPEEPEEPEETTNAIAERKKRSGKTEKARQKRAENAKARRATEAAADKAFDDYTRNGASVAREVTESLASVMQVPASARGLIIR